MDKAVVILSGGQDSTTCLLMAIDKYKKENVNAISFIYNNKYRKDIECAKTICQELNIRHEIYDIGVLQDISKTNNFEGRNLFLISLAAIYAKTNNIKNIIVGLAGNSIHPDCSLEFFEQLKKVISIGMSDSIKIEAPLINKEKSDIWKVADEMGKFDFIKNKTFSCWDSQNEPCGKCLSCKSRNEGMKKYLKLKEEVNNGK